MNPDSPKIVDKFTRFYREYAEDDIAELARRYPKDQRSIRVDFSNLYAHDPDLAYDLLDKPEEILECAERAVREVNLPTDASLRNVTVRVHNLPEAKLPSGLYESDVNTYSEISGQITRITDKEIRPVFAVWECQRCGTTTKLRQSRKAVNEPYQCQACERQGPFILDQEASEMVDQRKLKLEEPIEERAEAKGESITVYVEDELVDAGPGSSHLPDHVGEDVSIAGIIKLDESQLASGDTPETTVWLDAREITFGADVDTHIDVSEHEDEFRELAARDDAPELVAESLAPSLHAEEGEDLHTVRRACAAWLFNAYRIDPDGAESKRGDMHLALIGDPGTGKSTIMNYCHRVLPQSEYRAGPGLTKVGLTAAAVQEEFAGKSEWTLQPGVLPRADGGHCIIDEVDAVIGEDTKAIHDALEGEQLVKADKAGITADLPTRCAVLVGGNPTYSRFDPYEPIAEQIDLDPALFDRMDLVFTLEDEVEEAGDRKRADHMLESWKELTEVDQGNRDPAETGATSPAVPVDVLRAWIKYARETVFPIPTDPALDLLRDFYLEVRNLNDAHDSEEDAAVPATPRTLESSLRLAISFARLRLSDTVDAVHAERAIALSKRVVGSRFDPESGEFDRGMQRSGPTRSQASRKEQVRNATLRLQDQGDEPGVAIETLKDAVDADPAKVEGDIESALRSGDMSEPITGRVRWIQ